MFALLRCSHPGEEGDEHVTGSAHTLQGSQGGQDMHKERYRSFRASKGGRDQSRLLGKDGSSWDSRGR